MKLHEYSENPCFIFLGAITVCVCSEERMQWSVNLLMPSRQSVIYPPVITKREGYNPICQTWASFPVVQRDTCTREKHWCEHNTSKSLMNTLHCSKSERDYVQFSLWGFSESIMLCSRAVKVASFWPTGNYVDIWEGEFRRVFALLWWNDSAAAGQSCSALMQPVWCMPHKSFCIASSYKSMNKKINK